MIRLLGSAALAIGLVFGASTASATTISFGPTDWVYNSSDEIGWTVDIDDNTAGVWTVAISTNAGMGDTTGSLLGFGFDSTLSGLTLADLTKVSGSTSETFNGLYADSRGCGNGCNFNGAVSASEKFDYVVGIGSAGSSVGLLEDFTFTIATSEILTANSFTRVGLRAQSVGSYPNGGGGSVKDLNTTLSGPQVVPLPAAGWMLIAALGGLGVMKRRKSA